MSVRRLIYNFLLIFALVHQCVEGYACNYQDDKGGVEFGFDQTCINQVVNTNVGLHPDYEGWKRMSPTHIVTQYGGGVGLLSVGAGWDYGKKNQWETEFMIGSLPKCYSDMSRITLTLRENFIPCRLSLGQRVYYEPLNCALYLSVITGEGFWFREPDHYPDRYYKFPSRLMAHLSLGQRVGLTLDRDSWVRAASLFYELSINHLNILSKATNRHLRLRDIVYFSCGVRLYVGR